MSHFIEVEHYSIVESASFGSRETIIESQWINLDFVTNYHTPSKALMFSDQERMTLTEKGEKEFLKAIKEPKL